MKRQRFEIIAEGFNEVKDISTEALEVVTELQKQNISPIELIDYDRKEKHIYRKGTHDKNYFVRTKAMSAPEPSDNSTEAPGNSRDNENQMPGLPDVVKRGKSRSVKKQ